MALHHMWSPASKLKSTLSTQYKSEPGGQMLNRELFLQVLELELLRTKRSGRHFVLMVIESADLQANRYDGEYGVKMLSALAQATRATDMTGWYKDGAAIGVIFTEIRGTRLESITQVLVDKVKSVLAGSLGAAAGQVHISCQVLPGVLDSEDGSGSLEWTVLSGKQPGWSVVR